MTELSGVIHQENDRRGGVHLRLVGVFGGKEHRGLSRTLRQVLARVRPVRLVIDVGGVDVIDSRCVDVLLLGYTRALRGGHGFEVVGAHGAVRQCLEVAGLCARQADDEALYPPVWFDAADLLPPDPVTWVMSRSGM